MGDFKVVLLTDMPSLDGSGVGGFIINVRSARLQFMASDRKIEEFTSGGPKKKNVTITRDCMKTQRVPQSLPSGAIIFDLFSRDIRMVVDAYILCTHTHQ